VRGGFWPELVNYVTPKDGCCGWRSDLSRWLGWCGLVAKPNTTLLELNIKLQAKEWCAGLLVLF
jgi:hypothetical protein